MYVGSVEMEETFKLGCIISYLICFELPDHIIVGFLKSKLTHGIYTMYYWV